MLKKVLDTIKNLIKNTIIIIPFILTSFILINGVYENTIKEKNKMINQSKMIIETCEKNFKTVTQIFENEKGFKNALESYINGNSENKNNSQQQNNKNSKALEVVQNKKDQNNSNNSQQNQNQTQQSNENK